MDHHRGRPQFNNPIVPERVLIMDKMHEDSRPMRDLLLLLPLLQVTPAMEIDFAAADAALLMQIESDSDAR